MEKKLDSYDKAWLGMRRPNFGVNKKRVIKGKKTSKQVNRLDDVRLVGNMCIMILKFLVLLNILVITGRML